jgi:chromosome segregation ATPase
MLTVIVGVILWKNATIYFLEKKLESTQTELTTLKRAFKEQVDRQVAQTKIQEDKEKQLSSELLKTQTELVSAAKTYQVNLNKNLANKDAEIIRLKGSISKSESDLAVLNETLQRAAGEIDRLAIQTQIDKTKTQIEFETKRKEGLLCLSSTIPTEFVTELNGLR